MRPTTPTTSTLGDGSDTLSDSGGDDTDVLAFGAGITVADLSYTIDGADLVLAVGAAGDRIRVVDGLAGSTLERLDFADGSSRTLVRTAHGPRSSAPTTADDMHRQRRRRPHLRAGGRRRRTGRRG
jgi:hypothetical protein